MEKKVLKKAFLSQIDKFMTTIACLIYCYLFSDILIYFVVKIFNHKYEGLLLPPLISSIALVFILSVCLKYFEIKDINKKVDEIEEELNLFVPLTIDFSKLKKTKLAWRKLTFKYLHKYIEAKKSLHELQKEYAWLCHRHCDNRKKGKCRNYKCIHWELLEEVREDHRKKTDKFYSGE